KQSTRVAIDKLRTSSVPTAHPLIRAFDRRITGVAPRCTSRHFAGWNPGVFECVPGELQQQPLLWIHLSCFARGDTEERWLEQVDAADQPGRPGVAFARFIAIRMVKKPSRPTLRIDLRDGIP